MTTYQFYRVIQPISFLAIIVISFSPAFAQAAPTALASERLVKFNVIVTDRMDLVVDDVRKEDLQVTENGSARTWTQFARDDRPLTVGVVTDASGSGRRMLNYLIDADKIAAHTKAYEDRFLSPFVAAERGYVDEVIMPHSTRRRVARALRMLRNKDLENPWKKHDNIPL